VALEMLPGWMPDELRQLGYDGIITGEDKRILAHATEQKLILTSSPTRRWSRLAPSR
jgi:hypothetical protein